MNCAFTEAEDDRLAKIQSTSLHSSVFKDAELLIGGSN